MLAVLILIMEQRECSVLVFLYISDLFVLMKMTLSVIKSSTSYNKFCSSGNQRTLFFWFLRFFHNGECNFACHFQPMSTSTTGHPGARKEKDSLKAEGDPSEHWNRQHMCVWVAVIGGGIYLHLDSHPSKKNPTLLPRSLGRQAGGTSIPTCEEG